MQNLQDWAASTATPLSIHPLNNRLQLKNNPLSFRFAGQITGCEGYVEKCSRGFDPQDV